MAGGTGDRIVDGRFELLERLGSGGMGTVWRARDAVLDREVAVKEVRPPDPSSAPEGSGAARRLRARVLREARAQARLNHPHAVTIHQIVEDGPYPWLVMELLPGPGLQDRLADGPIDPREAARLGLQVLGALHTAHAAGIQHRDVKPANILLRADGSAVLTDFGIAALQGSTSLTATGELIGSPEFIAPERIRGTDDAPASDLWSLGLTLYLCTEGHSPLRRDTGLATLAAVLDDPVPPPVRSGALAPVLRALLVRDPAARPDAGQLGAMLTDVSAGRAASPFLPTEAAPLRPLPPHPSSRPSPLPQPPPSPPAVPPSRTGPGGTAPGGTGPGNTEPAPARTRPGPGRGVLIAVVAALVAALLAGTAYLADRSAGPEAGGGGANPVSSPTPDPSRTPDPLESADGPETPPAQGPTAPTETVSGPPTGAAPAPVPGDAHAGSWVAQLASVPKSEGTAARDQRLESLDATMDGVLWVDSDDFASLRPGYWMFYRPGPEPTAVDGFADGHAAADWCEAQGLSSSNQCVGRYLSHERDDRVHICAPDKSRGTGRCSRDR